MTRFEAWLRALSLIGVGAGLLTPVVYAQVTWHAFISLKVFWLQAVVGLCFPAYLILAVRRPEFRPGRTWVLLALVVHLSAVALSIPFAEDPHKAWWGTLDRMDGLWSLLHFGLWSIMAAGTAQSWHMWRRLLHIEVAAALLAGCVVILQVPFPSLLGQPTDVRVSGVFGNPVFSATYHVLMVFMIAVLWAKGGPNGGTKVDRLSWRLKLLYVAASSVSAAAIVLAGSRGSLVGLAGGAVAAGLTYGLLGGQRKRLLVAMMCLAAAFALYLTVAIVIAPWPGLAAYWERHQNLSHFFVLRDNAGRFAFWRLTLAGIRERPILGWGQCNFDQLFDRHYVPWQRCDPSGADNAHNFVLQTLAATGAVGLLAYLLLWGAVLWAIVRAYRHRDWARLPVALLLGMPVAYLAQGLFNPESPGPLCLCYLTFALASWLERSTPALQARWKPGIASFVVAEATFGAAVVMWTILPACASEYALLAVTDYRHDRPEACWRHARQAAFFPSPYLDDQLSVDFQLLHHLADRRELFRLPAWRESFAFDRALAERYFVNHKTLRFRLAFAGLLASVGFATTNASLIDEGEQRLRLALQDHPKRQEVMFALAALLAERGRLDEAEELYRSAAHQDPRIGECNYRLGRFLFAYRDLGLQGLSLIAKGTRAECPFLGGNFDEVTAVATAYSLLGDYQGLRSLVPVAEVSRLTSSARPYLVFAKYLEQAGMISERNTILRLGAKQSPEVAARALPVLRGQVQTLAETESASRTPPPETSP